MSELLEFTREEWADKPYLIMLRGGYHDGTRFHWHELPAMWRQPEPAPLNIIEIMKEPEPICNIPVADYRPTGNVTDDGAHIYQYSGHE